LRRLVVPLVGDAGSAGAKAVQALLLLASAAVAAGDGLDGHLATVRTHIAQALQGRPVAVLDAHDERAGFVASLAVVNYVQARVSPLAYGFLAAGGRLPSPLGPVESLAAEAGLCGNQVDAARALLGRLGLATRDVQAYWLGRSGPESHIALEVRYAHGWHFFDVTWGTYFAEKGRGRELDAASWAALSREGSRAFRRVTNESALALVQLRRKGVDPFHYIDGADCTLVGGRGTVARALTARGDGVLVLATEGLPAYLGSPRDRFSGELGDVAVQLHPLPSGVSVALALTGASLACSSGELRVADGRGRLLHSIALAQLAAGDWRVADLTSPRDRTLLLRVVASDALQPCYVTYGAIEIAAGAPRGSR